MTTKEEYNMDNITLRTVSPNGAKKSIKRAFKKKRPVFMWGPPGIGKSEIVDSITQDRSGYMIDMRLALMEPTDLRGIPVPNIETGLMEWLPPADLPTQELADQFECITLFLDEMNQAVHFL